MLAGPGGESASARARVLNNFWITQRPPPLPTGAAFRIVARPGDRRASGYGGAVDGDVHHVDVVPAEAVAGDGDQLVGQGLALAQGELGAGDGDLGVLAVVGPLGVDADGALQGAVVEAAGQVEGGRSRASLRMPVALT